MAEERQKQEKIIKGKATIKKKGELRKFTEGMIADDISKVKSYAMEEVILPTLKKGIWDLLTGGLDILLWGEAGRNKKSTSSSYISYRDFSKPTSRREVEHSSIRNKYDFDDIILESKGEGLAVIERMEELIETYGTASVADLYDLVDITCDYTDNNYGWASMASADVVRARGGGYVLKLSRPKPISRN